MADQATTILRIEHAVPDFASWKRDGFDRDPIGRAEGGVQAYRVLRSVDGSVAAIDLEFLTRAAATAFAAALVELWQTVQERFGWSELPQALLYESVETGEY